MKISIKLAGPLLLVSLAPLALSQQQSRIYNDAGNWKQEVTGSLAAAKNLKIKVDVGSVRVVGSSQPNITYVVRNCAYSSSEAQARREAQTGDLWWKRSFHRGFPD